MKKAFTLIELLAVIAILGIILIITIPSISQVIEKIQRNAFEKNNQVFTRATKEYFVLNRSKLPKVINIKQKLR